MGAVKGAWDRVWEGEAGCRESEAADKGHRTSQCWRPFGTGCTETQRGPLLTRGGGRPVEAEKGYSTDVRSKADWEDEVLGIAGGGKIERNRGKCCIFPPRNFFDNFVLVFF